MLFCVFSKERKTERRKLDQSEDGEKQNVKRRHNAADEKEGKKISEITDTDIFQQKSHCGSRDEEECAV